MRKYLVLALIPMFFAAMACQKSEEPAPESPAPAASAEASPRRLPAAARWRALRHGISRGTVRLSKG